MILLFSFLDSAFYNPQNGEKLKSHLAGEVPDMYGKMTKGKLLRPRKSWFGKLKLPLLPIKLKTIYVPQGPLADWSDPALREQVFNDLRIIAKKEGAVYIKIDPEIIYAFSEEGNSDSEKIKKAKTVKEDLISRGWQFSSQQIQFKNTAWIDLSTDEESILTGMKQKTRYNIRLAGRKGVTVKRGTTADIDLLYRMYLETSIRDGFIIRPIEYYWETWSTFIQSGMAVPLIAFIGSEPVAGLVLFIMGNRSWYLYGMSTSKHREKMPNYLLQWEAIKLSKERKCDVYDLWGAPNEFAESDDLWGVYRFKRGLGAYPVQRLGAYDLPLKKISYKISMDFIPRVLKITGGSGKPSSFRSLTNPIHANES